MSEIQARLPRSEAAANSERTRLPERGRSRDAVIEALRDLKNNDFAWPQGRLPLYIYYADEELLELQRAAFSTFMVENGHGKLTVFPSVDRMESDIVSMCLDIFSAPISATGTFTSGGTESILLAVKSARDWARVYKPAVTKPAMVLPHTAHPAFNKAAHYFGLDPVRVPVLGDCKADVAAMESAITEQTIFMMGSAPAYPHGVFDPIEELAKVASEYRLWFHVDACFGGFLAPFAREIGYPIPVFDFGIDGVWSLSADLHKYGFAAKGASFLGLRDEQLMEFQQFCFSDWARGQYTSPGMPGSRPAGSVAAAWSVMNYLGRAGYQDLAARTMRTRDRLVQGISRIKPLRCLVEPELSILVVVSNDPAFDITAIAAGLQERGWFASRSSDPPGLHFTVNPVHEPIVDDYLEDLAWAAETAPARDISTEENATY